MPTDSLQPGRNVVFRLGDVYLPSVREVLEQMSDDTELQGSITLISDRPDSEVSFVVVEVKGIMMPVIVPASCIKMQDEVKNLMESKSP